MDNPRIGDPGSQTPGSFEDQYTSATADLSAAGVMGSRARADSEGEEQLGAGADSTGSGAVSRAAADQGPVSEVYRAKGDNFISTPPPSSVNLTLLAVGAAVISGVAAVVGALLLRRRREEQNKPLNRLRRQLEELSNPARERLEDLPDVEVARRTGGGAGLALLLAALLVLRRLRSEESDEDEEETSNSALRATIEVSKPKALDDARRRLSKVRVPVNSGKAVASSSAVLAAAGKKAKATRPPRRGIGFTAAGVGASAGAGYLAWRMLRKGPEDQEAWRIYDGGEGDFPNQ